MARIGIVQIDTVQIDMARLTSQYELISGDNDLGLAGKMAEDGYAAAQERGLRLARLRARTRRNAGPLVAAATNRLTILLAPLGNRMRAESRSVGRTPAWCQAPWGLPA